MKTLFSVLLLVIISFIGVRAQDVEGCKDDPMLTRMPEYFIAGCSNSYNQVEVVTGVAKSTSKPARQRSKLSLRRSSSRSLNC